MIISPGNRLAKASKVYSGSRKSWIKNLYRFYSACRQTILFTWKGGMGTIMNLVIPVLDKHLYMSAMIELLGKFLVMKNDFAISMIRRS